MLFFFVSIGNVCAENPIADGYAFPADVDQGGYVDFFLSGKERMANAEIPIFDVSGNIVDTFVADLEPQQVANERPWENGFGYKKTVSYKVPDDLKSGIYYLAEAPVGHQSWYSPGSEVPFLVREESKSSEVVIVLPSNTGNAYNREGGNSIYTLRDPVRTVSFERPQLLDSHSRGFSRWLQNQSIDYRYISDVDMDDYSQISDSDLIVLIGHAEYWSEEGRRNFDRFVESGGEALVIAGNTMYRNVTYDDQENPSSFSYELQKTFFHWGEDYPISDSVGVDYLYGGHSHNSHEWTIADDTAPYLQGTSLKRGDKITSSSSEYDGIPIAGYDEAGFPIIDADFQSNYHYMNLIGFDRADTLPSRERLGAWIEFQETPSAGRMIVIGSTDWTHYGHYQEDREMVGQVTYNMIDYLLDFDEMGDFNVDGSLDVSDIDLLTRQILSDVFDEQFDINRDGMLNSDDRTFWLSNLISAPFGDSDLDGHFNSFDLVKVFRAAKYETNEPASWSEGDWDGNGRFDNGDLVTAFQAAEYETGFAARIEDSSEGRLTDRVQRCLFRDNNCTATTAVVPEPKHNCGVVLVLCIAGVFPSRRKLKSCNVVGINN